PHAGLFGHRNHRFQEIADVAPHLLNSVRAFSGKRRKVLDAIIVESSQSRAGPASFRVVTLHRAMSIKVVFHYRKPRPARCRDGSPDLVDFFVPAGPAIESVGKSVD